MDGPPEIGGNNMGVRPMEMLLLGMGGGTSVDVMQILQKGRQNITDCTASFKSFPVMTKCT
jgi:putative redox protein